MSAPANKFDITRKRCDLETFLRVEGIIRDHHGEKSVRLLEQAFEGGVPANAYSQYPDGRKPDYLSVALAAGNQDAMAFLIRLNYQELVRAECPFHLYFRYPKALQALADCGHCFQGEMESYPGLFWNFAQALGTDFFKAIAKNGTSLDTLITDGTTLLPPVTRYATHAQEVRLVESLLAAGADPAVRGTGGVSVLHGAVTEGRRVHMAKLDSVGSVERFETILGAVLTAGGNVDMTDDEGKSALHLACKLGYFNKARILMEAGADQHLKDKDGSTPEELARAAKRRDVLQLFAATRARTVILDVVSKAATAARTSVKT